MDSPVTSHRQSKPTASSSSSPSPSSVRSKKGCLTCRSKKVKCDEQRSVCGRCSRLHLKCEWSSTGQTAREKLKRQRERLIPQQILPKGSQPESPAADHISVNLDSDFVILPSFNNNGSAVSVPTSDEWDNFYQELGFTEDFLDLGNFAQIQGLDYDQNLQLEPNLPSVGHEATMGHNQTIVSWPSNISTIAAPSPSLSVQNITLSPTFELTKNERHALHHYQTIFSMSRTSKNTEWSTHAAMLRVGSDTPMVMHLLTAVSLMDLATSHNYSLEMLAPARQHFQTGAYLLIDVMNSGSEPDHVSVLTSFLFLYMYMSRQKQVDPNAIAQLSKAVLRHIKRFNLDVLSSQSLAFHQTSRSLEIVDRTLSRDKKEFIARLIVWLFYEDVWACAHGYGGSLASYLRAETERTDNIYHHSTTVLESFWGSQYPESEIIDDVENATVLKLLYDVASIHQDVNELCLFPVTDRVKADELGNKIAMLEENYRPILRLAKLSVTPRSRLLANADYIVAYFYALRIYHFRCTLTEYDGPAPPPVQDALASLLTIAQRSSASGWIGSIDKLQWPLFIAGIETRDAIYREWILSKLSSQRLKRAMERILQVQESSGTRADIQVVRMIVCSDGQTITGSATMDRWPLGIEGSIFDGMSMAQGFDM